MIRFDQVFPTESRRKLTQIHRWKQGHRGSRRRLRARFDQEAYLREDAIAVVGVKIYRRRQLSVFCTYSKLQIRGVGRIFPYCLSLLQMALFEVLIHPTAWNKVVNSYSKFPQLGSWPPWGVTPHKAQTAFIRSLQINVPFDLELSRGHYLEAVYCTTVLLYILLYIQ